MRHLKLLIGCSLFVASCTATNQTTRLASEAWPPHIDAAGAPIKAVFQSRVPCLDAEARAMACQRVKLALVLYHDAQTGAPSSFLLARVYVGNGGDEARRLSTGTWTLRASPALGAQSRIYELDASAPPEFRSFWAVTDNIVFVLDQNDAPRVGDAGYGYALNRTG